MTDLVLLGYVAKAIGLKGGLKLKLLNLDSESLVEGLKLTIKQGKLAPQELVISAIEGDGDRVYFEGITDRSMAEALSGSEIYIQRADMPEVENDEFYLNDLIGAEVKLQSGEVVGDVVAFASNTAQTLLEVKTLAGHVVSIPLVPAIVIEIDAENKKVIIDPPLGLLDLAD